MAEKRIEKRRDKAQMQMSVKWAGLGGGGRCGAWHIDVDIIVIQVSFKCATRQHFLTSAN